MSRVGNAPISLPSSVTVSVESDVVTVKGPKGELSTKLVSLVSVGQEDGTVVLSRADDTRPAKANHGLMRSLVANMVEGVDKGFEKSLEVIGVGYRANVRGSKLVMQLGYSHLVEFQIPNDIKIEATKDNKIKISGIDKQRVGQIAADIRSKRPPDHYKGKGIRYVGEYVRIKQGKTA